MSQSPLARTVEQIASEFGISESDITQAIQSGKLLTSNSGGSGPAVVDEKQLSAWMLAYPPARISASLSGGPVVEDEDRMQLLAKLPYLARRLVDADYAALTLADDDGRISEMIVSGMTDGQVKSIGHPPVGRGVLGSLDKLGAPLRLGDISRHPRSTGFPDGHPDMRSMIGVGVSAVDGAGGTTLSARLYVTRVSGRTPFTAEDQELIEFLGEFASQALDIESLKRVETDLRVRAEEAEQAKSDFMSMVNHDLKNPVVGMQLALAAGENDPEYRDHQMTDDLGSSLELQSRLLDSLLDMARLGRTVPEIEIEDCYVIDLANSAVRRQGKVTREQDREILVDVPEDLPAVRCDPVQIGRVLDNLISNALKYSEGAVTITAESDSVTESISIRVVDGGIGIPADQVERIFEPFERITTINRPVEGLGLGLAICRKIVEAHGWKIDYIASPEGGSIFEVVAPYSS